MIAVGGNGFGLPWSVTRSYGLGRAGSPRSSLWTCGGRGSWKTRVPKDGWAAGTGRLANAHSMTSHSADSMVWNSPTRGRTCGLVDFRRRGFIVFLTSCSVDRLLRNRRLRISEKPADIMTKA